MVNSLFLDELSASFGLMSFVSVLGVDHYVDFDGRNFSNFQWRNFQVFDQAAKTQLQLDYWDRSRRNQRVLPH